MRVKKLLLGLSPLALAVTPVMASAATQTGNTTVNATIASVISMTTSGTVTIGLTPSAGGAVSSASDTVTVNTNNTSGYNLKLSASDGTNTLTSGGNTLAAHAGTYGSPTALANGTWGYRIVSQGGFGATAYSAEASNSSSSSTWAGVPTSAAPTTVKTTGAVASNDVTTVWYGIRATTSQPNGTYTDIVTYTATTNP
jgi:predicted secreted protein